MSEANAETAAIKPSRNQRRQARRRAAALRDLQAGEMTNSESAQLLSQISAEKRAAAAGSAASGSAPAPPAPASATFRAMAQHTAAKINAIRDHFLSAPLDTEQDAFSLLVNAATMAYHHGVFDIQEAARLFQVFEKFEQIRAAMAAERRDAKRRYDAQIAYAADQKQRAVAALQAKAAADAEDEADDAV
jgi:hypothetical protein